MTTAPTTRWTNGDFLGANLLIDPNGRVCLVDLEFAARTHFFAEDAVRFHALSECARLQPRLFEHAMPDPGLAWHLFFWLRQIQLESASNTQEYLARTRPVRLGVIRRLAEFLLDQPLSGWPVPAVPVDFHLEQARWVSAADCSLEFAGWCHVPSTAAWQTVAAFAKRRLATAHPIARPDVQCHFDGIPSALSTGFALRMPPIEAETSLTLSAIVDDGAALPFYQVRAGDLPGRGPAVSGYQEWVAHSDPDPAVPEAGDGRQETHGRPGAGVAPGSEVKFSILLPLYNTPEAFLRECLKSVARQQHTNWELCLVDDGSDLYHVAHMLELAAAKDARFRLRRRDKNGGIAAASNDALALATGDFVVLLDHDDVLRPHALSALAGLIAGRPELDVVYSDEDKITADGRLEMPVFKPDFSPEFLLGTMYVGHVLAVRATVARAAGGFDSAYDGVQDYEFLLRVTERTRNIAHLPRVLYHWRKSPSSSALRGNIKGDMDLLQAQAVREHLARIGWSRWVVPLGAHRVLLRADTSQPAPRVSIIVAIADERAQNSAEVPQLVKCGGVNVVEVLRDAQPGVPIIERLRQLAARAVGEVLVFLTADPAGISDGWLTELAALATLEDSGAVAPLLLTSDRRIFESGWAVGRGTAAPLMRGFDLESDGYNGSLVCNREATAMSCRCFAIRRDRYQEVGGLRTEYGVPLAATDLCLRLAAKGRYNRIAANVRITVSQTWDHREQLAPYWAGFAEAWGSRLAQPDPFYNPNFDSAAGDYRLAPAPAGRPTIL